jgi:hypothetical protein
MPRRLWSGSWSAAARTAGLSRSLTVAELVEVYLAQRDVEPVTIEKRRWLLGTAVTVFGERPVGELRSEEIAAWRIVLSFRLPVDAPRRSARCSLGRSSGECSTSNRRS